MATTENDSPLTCDRCMSAPASLLLVAAKDARDRRPRAKALRAGERLLRLLCTGCADAERAILERGGRVFTILTVTAATRPLILDMTDDELYFVTSEAFEEWSALQRGRATADGGNEQRERWADLADDARAKAKEAFFREAT